MIDKCHAATASTEESPIYVNTRDRGPSNQSPGTPLLKICFKLIGSDSLDDSLSRSTSKDSMFEISTGQHSRSVTPIEKKSNNKLNLHFTQLGFQSAHRNSAKSHLIDVKKRRKYVDSNKY